MRLAQAGFCSCCFAAKPEEECVDFEVDFDGAPVLDRESGSIAVLPWTGMLACHDDLYLCRSCVREACELLALRPELQSRLSNENRRLELERDHWKSYAKRIEATVEDRPEAAPRARRTRKVKVAA